MTISTAGTLPTTKVSDLKTLCLRAAERWGDKRALRFDETGESLTFDQVDRRSNAVGRTLLELGVLPGDRVAVMLRNRVEFPLAWLAIAKIGAIMVPINVFYKSVDAGYLLEHSQARAVITSHDFLPVITAARQEHSLPLEIIVSVEGHADGVTADFPSLVSQASDEALPTTVYPENLANIQYTSGTTGLPKGCMLSHQYWTNMVRQLVDTFPHLTERDVLLTAQPFYYMDPQWNVAATLLAGAELVILDRFHPSSFWSKVREYDVTFFYCLGMMPTLMLKSAPHESDRDNKVRAISCSAIPVHLHRQLEERWGAPWYEGFGMTETGSDIRVTPDEHDALVGSGCIGRPKAHREARIVDEENKPTPRGELGELVLRGIGMMDGYYKNQEATDEAFRGGWFHTGDNARMDEQGLIFYVGRKKEMIRRSGENISATEVEEVIKLHPGVKMVACIPVPDEIRGEEGKAYVVLQDSHSPESLTPEALDKFCRERLAYFKVPRYWTFRDDLPRTPSERVAKGELRKESEDLRQGAYDCVDQRWR